MKYLFPLVLAAVSVPVRAQKGGPKSAFVFRDVTEEAGLWPDVAGIAGHGTGWGDVDGDAGLSSSARSARLFRNLGGFKFEDVTRAAGHPQLFAPSRFTECG